MKLWANACVMALMLWAMPAWADTKLDKIYHLLEINGSKQAVFNISRQLLESPDSPFNKPDPRLSDDFRQAIRDGFVEELQINWPAILLEIAIALEPNLSEDDVNTATDFFTSPAGQRYVSSVTSTQQNQQIGESLKKLISGPEFSKRAMARAFGKLKYQPGDKRPGNP